VWAQDALVRASTDTDASPPHPVETIPANGYHPVPRAVSKPVCVGVVSQRQKALVGGCITFVPSPVPLHNAWGLVTPVATDNIAAPSGSPTVAAEDEVVQPQARFAASENTDNNSHSPSSCAEGLKVAVTLVAAGPALVSLAGGIRGFVLGFKEVQGGLHAGIDMLLSAALPVVPSAPANTGDNTSRAEQPPPLTPQEAAVGAARRNVTAHVANLSGGVLSEDGALLQAAGDALEAGAHLALDTAVNFDGRRVRRCVNRGRGGVCICSVHAFRCGCRFGDGWSGALVIASLLPLLLHTKLPCSRSVPCDQSFTVESPKTTKQTPVRKSKRFARRWLRHKRGDR